jgi:hypothetical protein
VTVETDVSKPAVCQVILAPSSVSNFPLLPVKVLAVARVRLPETSSMFTCSVTGCVFLFVYFLSHPVEDCKSVGVM